MNEQEPEAAEEAAEQYALTVKWRGDDYGMRKRYYSDAFLAGAKWQRESAEAPSRCEHGVHGRDCFKCFPTEGADHMSEQQKEQPMSLEYEREALARLKGGEKP